MALVSWIFVTFNIAFLFYIFHSPWTVEGTIWTESISRISSKCSSFNLQLSCSELGCWWSIQTDPSSFLSTNSPHTNFANYFPLLKLQLVVADLQNWLFHCDQLTPFECVLLKNTYDLILWTEQYIFIFLVHCISRQKDS